MSIRCIQCGAADLEKKRIGLAGDVRGETYTVQMFGLECPNCGYKTIDGSDMPEYGRLLADTYRKAHGLLTSDELRSRRDHLDMNQVAFADYIGVGVASVKRWEMGKIQEAAMDGLIRLKTEPEAARRNLRNVESHVPEHLADLDFGFELEALMESEYVRPLPMRIDRSALTEMMYDSEPIAA